MSSTDEPQPDQPEDEAVPDEAAADETAPDETTADAVVPDEGPALHLDDLSTGPNAHGHGRTADQRAFAFRVRGATAVVEVYRAVATTPVPQPEDVEARTSRSVGEVDLHDADAVTALVRELVAGAEPVTAAPETTVMAFLGRLGTVVEDDEPDTGTTRRWGRRRGR